MFVSSPVDLESLRAKVEKNFPSASTRRTTHCIPIGIDDLDEMLGGGIALAGVSAWVGRPGSGVLSIVRTLVRRALMDQRRVAVVDGTARFMASDWLVDGNESNLWMMRLREVQHAFSAAETLARCGVFELVAVDVGTLRTSNEAYRAYLRRASKEGTSALLLIGEHVGSFGAKVVQIESSEFDLASLERTIKLSLVRGGSPHTLELLLDVAGQFIPCRMPSHSALPDRRPRAKRSST